MAEQQHGPAAAAEFEVGEKFRFDKLTFAVTKGGPKMIEAKPAKGAARWFWRSTLEKAGVKGS